MCTPGHAYENNVLAATTFAGARLLGRQAQQQRQQRGGRAVGRRGRQRRPTSANWPSGLLSGALLYSVMAASFFPPRFLPPVLRFLRCLSPGRRRFRFFLLDFRSFPTALPMPHAGSISAAAHTSRLVLASTCTARAGVHGGPDDGTLRHTTPISLQFRFPSISFLFYF